MTTVKAREMMGEPLDEKPVSKLPGVGQRLAANLNQQGLHLANDVYQVFINYKDKKRKFINWMKVTGKAHNAQSSNIYDFFMRYHEQFGEIESESAPKPKNGAKQILKGHYKRKGCASKTKSVKFKNANTMDTDSSQSSDTDSTVVLEHIVPKEGENVTKSDPLTSFFLSTLETVKSFPRPLQLQVKRQFFDIMINAEDKLVQNDTEPVASTSRCSPGLPPQSVTPVFNNFQLDNTATSTHVLNNTHHNDEATPTPESNNFRQDITDTSTGVLNNFELDNTAISTHVLNNTQQNNSGSSTPNVLTSVTIKQEKPDNYPEASTSEAQSFDYYIDADDRIVLD